LFARQLARQNHALVNADGSLEFAVLGVQVRQRVALCCGFQSPWTPIPVPARH